MATCARLRCVAACWLVWACSTALAAPVASEHRVPLQVFFRAYCPACQWFVTDPLPRLMGDAEFRDIVDLDLRPVAGMTLVDGRFQCEGEEDECVGHRWEACVINQHRENMVKTLEGIACLERDEATDADEEWEAKLSKCFKSEERTALEQCYKKESDELLRTMMATEMFAKVDWMPFVVVDGTVLGSVSVGVGLKDLRKQICLAFKGPKERYPTACAALSGNQVEFALPENNANAVTPEMLVQAAPHEGQADGKKVTPKMLAEAAPHDDQADGKVTPKMLAEAAPHDDQADGKKVTPKMLAEAEPRDDQADGEATPKMLAEAAPHDDLAATPKMLDPASPQDDQAADEKHTEQTAAANQQVRKIRLDVYWRAFCPGCMAFITGPLKRLFGDDELRGSIEFHPVPAVGVSYDANNNAKCISGDIECEGHQWLSCAIHIFPALDEMIKHLSCMEAATTEDTGSWQAVLTSCFSSADQVKMQACFDTDSTSLLKKHAAETRKDIAWTPFVVVDGKLVGDAQHGIDYKLLETTICSAFPGDPSTRPHACQTKRLREHEATEKVVKPCKQKKAKPTAKLQGEAPVKYEDAPGIGARPYRQISEKKLQDQQAAAKADAHINAEHKDEQSSFRFQSLLVPLVMFGAIVLLARRLSGDHKKHA